MSAVCPMRIAAQLVESGSASATMAAYRGLAQHRGQLAPARRGRSPRRVRRAERNRLHVETALHCAGNRSQRGDLVAWRLSQSGGRRRRARGRRRYRPRSPCASGVQRARECRRVPARTGVPISRVANATGRRPSTGPGRRGCESRRALRRRVPAPAPPAATPSPWPTSRCRGRPAAGRRAPHPRDSPRTRRPVRDR